MQDLPDAAAEAMKHGVAALADNDEVRALAWLGRAHRLMPADPNLSLLLASALSRSAPAKARHRLQTLLEQHPGFGAARIALAAVQLALGRTDEAAALLHAHLSSAAPPADTAFPRLASAIAARACFPGWVGLDSHGCLSGSHDTGDAVDFRLDGRPCAPRPPRSGGRMVLPRDWMTATALSATIRGKHCLGSPVDLRARLAASGVVRMDESGNLRGWAWMPADPAAEPRLRITAADGREIAAFMATDARAVAELGPGIARPRHFCLPAVRLAGARAVRVVGPDGHDLLGSPVSPLIERDTVARMIGKAHPGSAHADVMRPLPAATLPPLSGRLRSRRVNVPARKPIDVVIPVFSGAGDLALCLASVLPGLPSNARIVLVDAASRDRAMRAYLTKLRDERISILRHSRNRGFPAAANTGLRHAARAPDGPRDVVLLNTDTQVGAGWLDHLAAAAYARADIGSVTPMTNDGTLTSYPSAAAPAGLADSEAIARLDADCAAANAGLLVELPTAVGFCVYMRHDCLVETGIFRDTAFAQGYGAETDWSLRARHLGWRHAADTSTFVAHKGGASFGPEGAALRARNMAVLERLHPGANEALLHFMNEDPLFEARRRVDERRWRRGRAPNGAVILVTHAQGGGVERLVQARATALRAQGLRPIIVRPHGAWPPAAGASRRCVLADGATPFHNLTFSPGTALEHLAGFLAADQPRAVELHQMMGHDDALCRLAAQLGVPLDVHVHDYALICPRVTLCGPNGRYCGEPENVETCERCVADHGDRLHEGLGAAALRARSARLVSAARHVHVASREAARRIARYLPASSKTVVSPREDETALPAAASPRANGHGRRICVPGAIGDDKGYRILLACAQDAARRQLDLHFTVVGHTRDDARLMATGRVFVTGKYTEDEAVDLIAAQSGHIGFLPSVWPETWCYSLTLLWRAGLWPVAFDLGAQAERIAARGIGTVLPPGLPAPRINDVLTALRPYGA
jgi:GT2 family glycosyltransferase/glycosyltransferase involved in cell wall biosynthesis